MSQENAHAQKKSKKIENWEVYHSRSEWTYENNNGYYNDQCITKMRLTFQNNSQYSVKSINLMLKIKNCDGSILYKKKHTVSIDLDPDDKAPSKEFKLAETVCDYTCGFVDGDKVTIDVEILSVK